MLANDQQLETTLDRIAWFQGQVAYLRKTETNPVNYRAAVAGFLAEIDRMQMEVREYFSFLPAERAAVALKAWQQKWLASSGLWGMCDDGTVARTDRRTEG